MMGLVMKSHEILRKAIYTAGVKSVASDLGLSTSLLYKWCEDREGPDAAGADNPLDRLLKICTATEDHTPVDWLCAQLGSVRVDNPEVVTEPLSVLETTQRILKEFSDVLEAVSESYNHDYRIDEKESQRIRFEWDELKMVAESFVMACEAGRYESRELEKE